MVRLRLFLQEFTLMLLCWFYEKTALGDMISCSSFFDVCLTILLPYNVSKSPFSALPPCMASLLANAADIYRTLRLTSKVSELKTEPSESIVHLLIYIYLYRTSILRGGKGCGMYQHGYSLSALKLPIGS